MENINIPKDEQANDDFLTELTISSKMNINNESENIEPSLDEIEREKLKSDLKEKEFYENDSKNIINEEHVTEETTTVQTEKTLEDEILASENKPKEIETKTEEEIAAQNIVHEDKIENIQKNDESTVYTTSEPIKSENNKEESTSNNIDNTINRTEQVTKQTKSVEILSPKEATELEKKSEIKTPSVKENVEISDDLDKKLIQSNRDILLEDDDITNDLEKDNFDNLGAKEINEIIDDTYDNKPNEPEIDDGKIINVSIVNDTEPLETTNIDSSSVTEEQKKPVKKHEYQYYGGDGKLNSFKIRSAKTAKILRNISVDETAEIEAQNIANKTKQERQDIYLKTVLPTLQPTMSVIPLIISGTVITMSAFSWPDVRDICAIEDKLLDLDVNAQDYTYEKNLLFIQKREKELEMFYKHIIRVSGYEIKPSFEELFGKIILFPDFQQLFFAAYVASFQKNYSFDIPCPKCGTVNPIEVNSKDLCFLLNSNININQLNYYVENGSSLDASESGKIYQEFQKEKIVELAKSTYRTKRTLPNSSFVYDLKIPTVLDALNTMKEMIITFKDRDLSYTDPDTGETVYIDSSFGLTSELIELRSYLYIKSLIVARVVDENKETNSAKVSFVEFDEKPAIVNSIYNLSPEDYRVFLNDENLRKLIKVTGIRHAINGGKCSEPTCESEIGNIPVEPEPLFFMIARQEFV